MAGEEIRHKYAPHPELPYSPADNIIAMRANAIVYGDSLRFSKPKRWRPEFTGVMMFGAYDRTLKWVPSVLI